MSAAAPSPIRVLIADDSAFMRKAIVSMLESDPGIKVVGVARHGKEALELAKSLQPDVVTLDIEMPEMDGLTALRRIMAECPANVLMFSSLTKEGSTAALSALRLGAADVLAKEQSQMSVNIMSMRDELVAHVRAIAGTPRRRSSHDTALHRTMSAVPVFRPGQFDAVCIGSSTGGPPVVETLVSSLPADFAPPVIVAQHMPEVFTKSMAERLGGLCKLPVVHVEDGMAIKPRTVHICPGSHHTHLTRLGLARHALRVSDEPKSAIYRPSVDVLLDTAASVFGARALGIVLTGMGDDGLRGARALHAKGGTILAQSAETCVVYGMPKAVTENGLIAASLTPSQIARALGTLAGAGAGGIDLKKAG